MTKAKQKQKHKQKRSSGGAAGTRAASVQRFAMPTLGPHPLWLQVRHWGPRATALVALLLGSLCVSALNAIDHSYRVRQAYGSLQQLQESRQALLERRAQLLVERSMLSDLARVEQVASTRLEMIYPPLERNEADGGAHVAHR